MNPHKLSGGATYYTDNPFDAMTLASKVGGSVFRYTHGNVARTFGYAITQGDGAILFNKFTLQPCDRNGNPIRDKESE